MPHPLHQTKIYNRLLLDIYQNSEGLSAVEYLKARLERTGIRRVGFYGSPAASSSAFFSRYFSSHSFFTNILSTAYGVEIENLSAVHEHMEVYRLGDDPLPPADCMVICDLNRVQEKLTEAGKVFGPLKPSAGRSLNQ